MLKLQKAVYVPMVQNSHAVDNVLTEQKGRAETRWNCSFSAEVRTSVAVFGLCRARWEHIGRQNLKRGEGMYTFLNLDSKRCIFR